MRDQSWTNFEAILILQNTKLTCYKHGQECDIRNLDLDEYTIYKTLAHTLIFYSQKHNLHYQKINDLCTTLKDRIKSALQHDEYENTILFNYHKQNIKSYDTIDQYDTHMYDTLFNYDIPTLKRLASELYLQSLHQITQEMKSLYFDDQWPNTLLILVAGPASPRFEHPAMQYFTRLTNNELETNTQMIKDNITFTTLNDTKYIGRKLYYIENCNDLSKIIEIGLSLYVEETEFNKYESMKKDILAKPTQDYLLEKCNK